MRTPLHGETYHSIDTTVYSQSLTRQVNSKFTHTVTHRLPISSTEDSDMHSSLTALQALCCSQSLQAPAFHQARKSPTSRSRVKGQESLPSSTAACIFQSCHVQVRVSMMQIPLPFIVNLILISNQKHSLI